MKIMSRDFTTREKNYASGAYPDPFWQLDIMQ